MSADALRDQAAGYVLGALDDAETRAFEDELAGNPNLEALVREYREVSAQLALAAPAPAVPPRPELADQLVARVRTPASGVTPLVSRRRWTWLALAASAAGLLLAGIQTARLAQRHRLLRELTADLATATSRRDLLQRRLDAILDAGTVMYQLRPTSAADTGRGGRAFGAQVFWRRDQQTWLVHAYEMPRLPPGRVYQLWFVTPAARISAGVFEVDAEGHGIAVLTVPPEAHGAIVAAMSVEPGPGGSVQPTGPIVMAGSVASD